ncbi:MAG TPA: MFS transporter [Actinomycetota bacterium]|nr:MFS transporter [Actinomycetota bacterium]
MLHERSGPRASIVAAFAVHATVSGSLGPRLPAIKAQAGLSDAALGSALVGFAAGLFVGTRLASWPIRRFGSRATLRIGIPVFAVSLIGPALARDLASLTLALVVMSLAAGLLDVAMNANAVVVERSAGTPIMSGIHGVWSAGLLVASIVAAGSAALGMGPLPQFVVVAAVLVPLSVPLLRGLIGDREDAPTEAVPRSRRRVPWTSVLPLGAIGFCSFLGEGAMHDWSALYLREPLRTSQAIAALGFTGFALGMTVSRFLADRWSTRFGPVALVRAGGLVAAVALAVGLLVPQPAVAIAGFTVLGAGLAPVVPTVFSAAGNLGHGSGATALGWVVTISYLGGILGPGLIGFISGSLGLRAALSLPVVLASVIVALAGRVGTAQRATGRSRGP